MRLGTRWAAGATAPAAAAALADAIAQAEESLSTGGPAASWTLTWLEGRPVAELDDGAAVTVVSLDHDGAVVVRRDEE